MGRMNGRPLVFIDIETTGMGPQNSRVLEIGALRVEDGQVVKTYKQLINPEEPVPSFITGLTGINGSDVHGAPTFGEVAHELSELFNGAIFVAHNVSFDYGFIKAEFARLGQLFAQDRICTVRLSRKLYPAQRSHRLDEVIRIHGYDVESRHRAYDDAEILYKFYQDHLLKLGDGLHTTMGQLLQPAA